MKKLLSILLTLSLLFALASCTQKPAEPTQPDVVTGPDVPTDPAQQPAAPEPTTEPEPEPEPSGELPNWVSDLLGAPTVTINDEYHFYDFDGFVVPVPNVYAELMKIDTLENEAPTQFGQPLIAFYEQASIDAGQKMHPGEDWGDGWLCTITRMDQLEFERWLCAEKTGTYLFARDDDGHYFLMDHPTDVRVMRYNDFSEESLASWSTLMEWANEELETSVCAENDNVEAYYAAEYFDTDATYDSEHVYYTISPVDNYIDSIIFTLSQPAKWGEGGVWCVDRMTVTWKGNEYNDYRQVDEWLNFPANEGIEQPAGVWYPWVQEYAPDEYLDPKAVVISFTEHAQNWFWGEVTEDMLLEAVG